MAAEVVAAADEDAAWAAAVDSDGFGVRFDADLFCSAIVLLATDISEFSSTNTLHGLASYDHETIFEAETKTKNVACIEKF